MFDIGFGEIFLIAVVALLVLGPERLPKAARFAGLWVRRARAQWYSVKAEFENELADEDLKRSLKQTRSELMEARDSLARSGADLKKQLDEAHADTQDSLRGAVAAATAVQRDESDDDLEPPLGSVSDAAAQPELPLDDAAHDDASLDDLAPENSPSAPDDTEAARPAGPGHDAGR